MRMPEFAEVVCVEESIQIWGPYIYHSPPKFLSLLRVIKQIVCAAQRDTPPSFPSPILVVFGSEVVSVP